jgi:hypothetical protein
MHTYRKKEYLLLDRDVSFSKERISDGCVNTGNVKSTKETEIVSVVTLVDRENEEGYMKHRPEGNHWRMVKDMFDLGSYIFALQNFLSSSMCGFQIRPGC